MRLSNKMVLLNEVQKKKYCLIKPSFRVKKAEKVGKKNRALLNKA